MRPPALARRPESNQPVTSTNTSVVTNDDTHTSPEPPTGTTTAFGSTEPAATKVTDDVPGSDLCE